MPSLWDYVQEYPGRLRNQFTQGMQQFARTRNPVAALGAINPTTPFIQDAALQAGGLIAPQTNQLSQAVSQASENLGLGPLSIPEVTDEQLAPFLMLGMGSPSKMGFYSPSGKALTTAPGKGTSQQYLAHLKKEPGATKEAKQTGLIQSLEEAPGTLTKEEVVSMWNPIELTETVKGDLSSAREVNLDSPYAIPEVLNIANMATDTPGDLEMTLVNNPDAYYALEANFPELLENEDWGEIVVNSVFGGDSKPSDLVKYGNEANLNLPGGEGPKEILVQLPSQGDSAPSFTEWMKSKGYDPTYRTNYVREYQEEYPPKDVTEYKSGHWDEPNVLAHIRTNKRDVGGVRALHAEEFQSDWHQAGQKKGYVDNDQKRALENRLTEIQKAIRASNQQIAGNNDVGLLKKLDGDTSGLNVMISNHPEGGTNFADKYQNVASDYAFIGHIDRNGKLSTTKYTTPEQKILLEKQAELVRERNSIRNDLRPMSLSSGKVPDAPFKKDWHELSFKRFLMEGINDPSVDRITWTSGDVQADRYNLAKYVETIEAVRTGDTYDIVVVEKNGTPSVFNRLSAESLADYVGKEMAEKIVNEVPKSSSEKTRADAIKESGYWINFDSDYEVFEVFDKNETSVRNFETRAEADNWIAEKLEIESNSKTFSGLDLQVGGEFHKQLYDKKIPQFAKKFLKKYGVEPQRISEFDWRGEEQNLWYIDITPEMRQDLQQKGVPLAMNNRKPQAGLLA